MGHLRLADRRGCLTGKLSPVQETGLTMVMAHERQTEKINALADLLRNAAPSPASAPEEVEPDDADDFDESFDAPGSWQMPEMDPKDAMTVLQSMGKGGTISMDDLSKG